MQQNLLVGALKNQVRENVKSIIQQAHEDNGTQEQVANQLENLLQALNPSGQPLLNLFKRSSYSLTYEERQSLKNKPISYHKINIYEDLESQAGDLKKDQVFAAKFLLQMLELRQRYMFQDDNIKPHPYITNYLQTQDTPNDPRYSRPGLKIQMQDGVLFLADKQGIIPSSIPSLAEFYADLSTLLQGTHNVIVKSFCHKRIMLLEKRFKMHYLKNAAREILEAKAVYGRDFYTMHKVDNHVHLAACMSQEQLLEFIKKKMNKEPDTIIDAKGRSLIQALNEIGITQDELTVDALDVQADHTTFQRFDKFNAKYNPMGQPILRELFLKTDNFIQGRYFAEMCKEVIEDLEQSKYICAEYRISIYGKGMGEWDNLAQWFIDYEMDSTNVRWMIQIPRIYKVYRSQGLIQNFQQMIDNIFLPIFQATLHPEDNPNLTYLLSKIVGFDSVDDESAHENITSYSNYTEIYPEQWTSVENPPYSHWSYYIYANLFNLNLLRKARGMNTIAFRPHCGEAGSHDHLATAFLTAQGINHGIELDKNLVLQYLYYIGQVGLSVSPLSNNRLFLRYEKNPFLRFFWHGLNATLSTDDPMILHLTKQPLLEEYSVAAQIWNLSQVDLCEITVNSIMQSGYDQTVKRDWLGDNFQQGTIESHSVSKTNIPCIRKIFRIETYEKEFDLIDRLSRD